MTKKKEPNIPLLRKAVEWAEGEAAKPDELCGWYQPQYAMPVKNQWGLVMNFLPQRGRGEHMVQKSEEINGCGTAFCIAGWVHWQGTGNVLPEAFNQHEALVAIDTYALKALGLTVKQGGALFDGNNSIQQVRAIAEEIAGERL